MSTKRIKFKIYYFHQANLKPNGAPRFLLSKQSQKSRKYDMI